MIDKIRTIFSIPELREKIFYTLAILIVVRVGAHIPIPGVDANALSGAFDRLQDTLFGLFNMFVGGAFEKASLFSLGIMPYISSSIIIQLMGSVLPYFQRLQKEGEAGRKKITQITRYGTVLIATMQSYGVTVFLEKELQVVVNPGFLFVFTAIISMVTGTILLMWMGEKVTERGIGNGISLIIMVGIVSRLPFVIGNEIRAVLAGEKLFISEIVLMGVMFLVICFVVLLTQGTRKIPVQYAKRVVGRKVYGGQASHIPLKILTAGVMPIIFAQALMFIPQLLGQFTEWSWLLNGFAPTAWAYNIVFAVLVIIFTYFYTAIAFNPADVADNMQKQGGFIPGVRPGRATSDFIDNILTRVTLPASIALAFIAILPFIFQKYGNIDYSFAIFFGGTSIIIAVGVALDTMQQIEGHLVSRHYDGFLKTGRIKGRSKTRF